MASRVWNSRRKWLGNVIPALFYVPLGAFGVLWMLIKDQFLGVGSVALGAALVLGWLTLNQFGLFENAKMRRELDRELRAQGSLPEGEAFFVGFAAPGYQSMLDAHQDVGFLVLGRDKLEFISEDRRLQLPRDGIKGVRFKPNVHSILGLGRWIAVEGTLQGQPVRLQIEPRVERTLLANKKFGKQLAKTIDKWRATRP